MADSVPAGWRTVWRPQRNAVRHDFGTLSAIAGTKPVTPPPGGASRRKPFSPPPFAPFAEERDGGPTEACDAQNQRHTPPTSVGGPVELPADRQCDGLRQDGGRRVPAASERSGADELGGRGEPRRGRARATAIPGDGEAGDAAKVPAATGLGVGARRAGTARPQSHADAAVDGVQGRAPRRLSVLAVRRALPSLREEALRRAAPAPPARREDLRRLLRRDRTDGPGDGRARADAAVRGRTRRKLVHVRLGDALAVAAGVARLPCADVRLLSRRQRSDDPR